MIVVRYDFHNYRISRELAKGSSCIVVEAMDKDTGRMYAIKVMKRSDLEGTDLLVNVDKEINVIQQLHHKNIAECREVIEEGNQIYIVMEHCGTENLLNMIIAGKLHNQPALINSIFYQVCEAIQYLHEMGIAHGDIKPDNIMVTKDGTVKLTDFGYCHTTLIAGDNEKGGTVYYAGPEMFLEGKYNTQSADIWSLGVLLFVMITATFPFTEDDEVQDQILAGRLFFPTWMNEEYRNLVEWLTIYNPGMRPRIQDVMADSMFNDFNSDKDEKTGFDCPTFGNLEESWDLVLA